VTDGYFRYIWKYSSTQSLTSVPDGDEWSFSRFGCLFRTKNLGI